ncbi:DUF4255 domain-containing protein [Carbonactinospora thermoautotrophica]|uniref:DUF4255 domain-containing protein n=1 Tax=Carbonactinospora thermoautotrophica TaxID=1469144 RepID=UPI00226D6F3C|nr:DUF4255 domain-containing protein [Carbonactinospora thermoautotrophica]
MSNHLAVAAATEALRLFLARAVQPDFPFAVEVAARKPPTEPPTDPTITVFLYQVTPNAALRNQDAPTRAADGAPLTRPAAALDLHYLISCYGEESQLVPQRLLGSVVRSLHQEPVLSRRDIEDAQRQAYLLGADLAASPQRVRFTPTPMDVDELSKLWSTLFQTPYALSVVYQGTAVLLEGRQAPAAGKPVLRRTVTVTPTRQPLVDRVLSRRAGAGPGTPPAEGPVPRDHELVLVGSGLRGTGHVTARLGDLTQEPAAVGDIQAVVPVPEPLPPGVYPVQLVYGLRDGDEHRVVESNAVPFVRQPRIAGPVRVESRVVTGGGLVSATLAVPLDLPVGDEQRARLLLDELDPPAGRATRSYQFTAPYPLGERPDPKTVRVPVERVQPAKYLVRVQVDGAQSPLDVADGRFSGPAVDLAAS